MEKVCVLKYYPVNYDIWQLAFIEYKQKSLVFAHVFWL